jgi:hypothetical protein
LSEKCDDDFLENKEMIKLKSIKPPSGKAIKNGVKKSVINLKKMEEPPKHCPGPGCPPEREAEKAEKVEKVVKTEKPEKIEKIEKTAKKNLKKVIKLKEVDFNTSPQKSFKKIDKKTVDKKAAKTLDKKPVSKSKKDNVPSQSKPIKITIHKTNIDDKP